MPKAAATVFIDTSISISRFFSTGKQLSKIEHTLSRFGTTATGLVTRQEFRRRVLMEAEYLLNIANLRSTVAEVHDHISRLPPLHNRKKQICLRFFTQIMKEGEPLLLKDLKLLLRSLIIHGLDRFDKMVDHVFHSSGCGCALQPVRERKPLQSYDIGVKRCDKLKGSVCRIGEFLDKNRGVCNTVLAYLDRLPPAAMTSELQKAAELFRSVRDASGPQNPSCECLAFGDALIAIESQDCGAFYTLNIKESKHLCRPLGQDLVICHNNPDKPDDEYAASESTWD